MKFRMSAPSKTFLTGDYAVMMGGAALLLSTLPRFEFLAEKTDAGEPRISGIPEGSPAHTWLKQREPLLNGWALEFLDPHEKRGGFGASGAQFLFVHAFTTSLQFANRAPKIELRDLFHDYQVCARGSGSGADILSQFAGGVARVSTSEIRAEKLSWPYPDLGFAVVRTGVKTATHLHLATLEKTMLSDLRGPAEDCARSFGVDDERIFAAKVNDYGKRLVNLGLQAPRTLELLSSFQAQSWCLAAKGCGALGADTIVLLFEKGEAETAAEHARTLGLPIVTEELSGGLEVAYETN